MDIDKSLKERIALIFKDFKTVEFSILDTDIIINDYVVINVPSEQFPIPKLVLFVFYEICNFVVIPRCDKMHWGVVFSYKNEIYIFSHEKFGLRLYISKNNENKISEMLGRLQKNVEFIEKNILENYASSRISENKFTIQNNFHRLNNQYLYFRSQADNLFKKNTFQESTNISNIFLRIYEKQECDEYAVYNSLAMIDLYFSRLEHILVLLLPLLEENTGKYSIQDFIGGNWSENFGKILDIQDKNLKKLYDKFKIIKEKYRNTFAHGGFEKRGQSFYFHLESYGAIPATMSGFKDSVYFNCLILDEEKYRDICQNFDDFDNYLSEKMEAAWLYIKSGLDLIMDDKYLEGLHKRFLDIDEFESWLEDEKNRLNSYINIDY